MTTLKAEKLLLGKKDFPKRTFTERQILEIPSTNLKTGSPGTQLLHKLHPTKATHRFPIFQNRTAKRNL